MKDGGGEQPPSRQRLMTTAMQRKSPTRHGGSPGRRRPEAPMYLAKTPFDVELWPLWIPTALAIKYGS